MLRFRTIFIGTTSLLIAFGCSNSTSKGDGDGDGNGGGDGGGSAATGSGASGNATGSGGATTGEHATRSGADDRTLHTIAPYPQRRAAIPPTRSP